MNTASYKITFEISKAEQDITNNLSSLWCKS